MTTIIPEFQVYIPIGDGYEVGIHKVIINTGDTYTFNCKKLRRADGAVLPSIKTLAGNTQFINTNLVTVNTTKETVELFVTDTILKAHTQGAFTGPSINLATTIQPQDYYQAGLHFGGGNLGE